VSKTFWLIVAAGGVLAAYRLAYGKFPWQPTATLRPVQPIRVEPRPAPTTRLAEDHLRGAALTPQTWSGLAHGSVQPSQLTGTFDGSVGAGLYLDSQLLSPEKRHVTPQIEAALAQSVQRRAWFGGGTVPVQGTFG